MKTPLLPAAAVLLLGACASSPRTRFYTLTATRPANPAQRRIAVPLEVDAVHLPPTLARRWMVREIQGPAVTISGRDRWAANLGTLCRRVLSEDLASRLPAGKVIAPDSPAPAHTRGVVVAVLDFGPRTPGEVALDAEWTLVAGVGARPVMRDTVHLLTHAGPTARDEAAALSALLGRLADHIAQGVAGHDGQGPPGAG